MPSYIPEVSYGPIRDADGYYSGKYGLLPWPDHLKPRQQTAGVELTKKGEAYCASRERLEDIDVRSLFGEPDERPITPKVMEADGVFFLALSNDRATIAYTVQRLIDMLDSMDGDIDYEATAEDDEDAHDREEICEDEGAQCEDEGGDVCDEPHDDGHLYSAEAEGSLGWQNEGSQAHLLWDDKELEPDLGTTEEVDQVRRLECVEAWMVEDSEPDLGWSETNGRGIISEQNCLDDREHDDEREINGDEADYDGGEADAPIFTPGGGSVSQQEDGWRPASGSAVAPAMLEKAERLPNGDIARTIIDQRDAVRAAKLAAKQRRYYWDEHGVGNLPPEAFEGFIPEIEVRGRPH